MPAGRHSHPRALLAAKRIVALLVLGIVLWQGWYLGWVLWWKWVNPGTTAFMAQRLDELRERNPKAELMRA